MEARNRIIEIVSENLPLEVQGSSTLKESSILAELGLTSLHIISILIALNKEYLLDIESVTRGATPRTIADLIAAVARGRTGAPSDRVSS